MITVTQQFETEDEAREALNWRRYSVALGRIKDEVRRVWKYTVAEHLPSEVDRLYLFVIEELNDAGWEE
jgi:hypothetical protein